MSNEFTTVKIRKKHLKTIANMLPHCSATKTLEILLDLMINSSPVVTKLLGETISDRIKILNSVDIIE